MCVSQHLMGHVAAQYKAHTGRDINWLVTARALRQLGVTDEEDIARRVARSLKRFETRLAENAEWDRSMERKTLKTKRLTREAKARDIFNRYLLASLTLPMTNNLSHYIGKTPPATPPGQPSSPNSPHSPERYFFQLSLYFDNQ